MEIKNIIIFLIIFVALMWFQHNDDIKFDKKRVNLYDKIKIPLIATILIILIKDFDYKDLNYKECANIFIVPPLSENTLNDIYIGPPDF